MPEYWKVPRLWEGRTVAVLASGESMSKAVADTVRDAELPAIVVNTTFRLAPWADLLYAADREWWTHESHADAFRFAGLKVSVSEVRGVLLMRHDGLTGLSDEPDTLRTGSNSGYQALHIAVHGGARRVLLCGFNFTGSHWHGRHPHGLRETAEEHYARWRGHFDTMLPALQARGVEVLNCTPKSKLTAFPMMGLDEAIARCREP